MNDAIHYELIEFIFATTAEVDSKTKLRAETLKQ